MNICFMGTPDIAVPTLQALIERHTVSCVVTQPDKPKGRGKKLTPPPVKVLAQQHHIPVLQPSRARALEFFTELSTYAFDVIVVIAYGQILPQAILNMCSYGALNIHGSLLPKYRGASPIQSAILNGEITTGVTIMQMDAGMDTGDMLLKREIPVGDHTSGSLFELMGQVGAEALLETLTQIQAGTVVRTPQDDSQATHAPLFTKAMGLIDWTQTSQQITSLVNAMNPWPSAYTLLAGEPLKIHSVRLDTDINTVGGLYLSEKAPGQVLAADSKHGIWVGTGDGALPLTLLQAKGGKAMAGKDYVNGRPIEVGTVLC